MDNHTLRLLFTEKGGKKQFHIDYIQEMSNALVLYWLNEKYHQEISIGLAENTK